MSYVGEDAEEPPHMSHKHAYQVEDSNHIPDDFETIRVMAMENVRSHDCRVHEYYI